jgi:hypothetical protein
MADGVQMGIQGHHLVTEAIKFHPDWAPMIGADAVEEQLNSTGLDGAVNPNDASDTDFNQANKKMGSIVKATFKNADLTGGTDPAARTAAVMANITCAINANAATSLGGKFSDNHIKAVQKAVAIGVASVKKLKGVAGVNVKVAVGGLMDNKVVKVKGVGNINAVGDGLAPAPGAAGLVTGAIAQAQGVADYTSNELVGAIVKGAVKKAKNLYLEIAQAAATSAGVVVANGVAANVDTFATEGGDDVIINAVLAALGANGPKKKQLIIDTVAFGLAQAKLWINNGLVADAGAGAAGIAYYAHNNCTGPKVTDISGL